MPWAGLFFLSLLFFFEIETTYPFINVCMNSFFLFSQALEQPGPGEYSPRGKNITEISNVYRPAGSAFVR